MHEAYIGFENEHNLACFFIGLPLIWKCRSSENSKNISVWSEDPVFWGAAFVNEENFLNGFY